MNDYPKDLVMFLSYLNLKLRDYYSSLSDLCEDLEFDEDDLKDKMRRIGYEYSEVQNAFIRG